MTDIKSYKSTEEASAVVEEPAEIYARKQNMTHFAVMAIEAAAEMSHISPMEMHRRLERMNLVDRLLYGQYEAMHSQSLKHVAEDVVTALHNWEKQDGITQSADAS